MGSPNGGIIGVINPTSFGKDTVTSKTSSGDLTTQPGTRLVDALIVAGGGGGGKGEGIADPSVMLQVAEAEQEDLDNFQVY
jgi:hypothetical protein